MVQTAVLADGALRFERGQRVVCKPDAFAYAAGVGEVKAIVYGNVIVYFESVGRAQVYVSCELDAAPVAARLPLSTPVRLRSGIEGVISGHSTCDAQRYRVSWFDRALWVVRHKWTDRVNFEVIASLTAGIGVALVATPEQVQQAATSV